MINELRYSTIAEAELKPCNISVHRISLCLAWSAGPKSVEQTCAYSYSSVWGPLLMIMMTIAIKKNVHVTTGSDKFNIAFEIGTRRSTVGV